MRETTGLRQRDMQDYLDASGEASKRTRNVIIILVIAIVLVFAGYLNSQQTSWMRRRMIWLADMRGQYAQSKLGEYPKRSDYKTDPEFNSAVEDYSRRHHDLWSSVAKTYVENSLVIRVPFFGFSFDINDLGLLGGVGLLTILVCYRFFLSREIDNLRLSFEAARQISLSELAEFYKLLAMRQVFTVPRSEYINRSTFLRFAPKTICWFGVVVYGVVVINDVRTAWIGRGLAPLRYESLIGFEFAAAILLIVLAYGITERLVRMERLWDSRWEEIQRGEVAMSPPTPSPAVPS